MMKFCIELLKSKDNAVKNNERSYQMAKIYRSLYEKCLKLNDDVRAYRGVNLFF